MKLLVLTTRLFDRPASGGEICTARLLDALRQEGHALTLLGRGDAARAAAWAPRVVSLGPIEPPFDEQGRWRRLRAVGGAMLSGLPVTVHRQGGPRVAAQVARWLDGCDAVVVDHLQAWPWLGTRTDRPMMLVQHNIESDNYLRLARAANRGYQGQAVAQPLKRHVMRRESKQLAALELDALQRAAVVACLSEGDAARLDELALRAGRPRSARLVVLPGYPLATPSSAAPGRPETAEPMPAIGLIGTWTWAPNREGLRWFIDRVWPGLSGRARLVIAGAGLDGMALPADARWLGRVADVAEFFSQIDLVAVPSLTGSGVQEKAIEAIASGLPVVATPHALRGLGDALPAHVQAAGDAARFVAACLAAARTPDGDAAGSRAAAISRWTQERRQRYAEALALGLRELGGTGGRRPRVPLHPPLGTAA